MESRVDIWYEYMTLVHSSREKIVLASGWWLSQNGQKSEVRNANFGEGQVKSRTCNIGLKQFVGNIKSV